ncbi:uncharacterized protein LOC128677648 [Plodia interpunctella]|uniref:uncharacterized protein LOC128677648 n=1 Tax=Plodia interpunctella TaxID=58824 RepID=UPI002368B72F|nr:uncharacterized protein LOC128677648 [Plodia interpunctella]
MMQKTRPIEAFQQVLSAFKLFEKKLDKLQDDVNSHGQTLSDLRNLVSNLAIGVDPKIQLKLDDKRLKKSMAVQYDNHPNKQSDGFKTKRKNTIQSLPSKLKPKGYPTPTIIGMRPLVESPFGRHASMPKMKHAPRLGKTSSLRKATTLRTQKGREKREIRLKTKTK